jgi:hypothetical protein
MQTTYIAIRDHLEQAHAILRGRDAESRKLREVLQMVIGLIDDLQIVRQQRAPRGAEIIDFPEAATRPARPSEPRAERQPRD